MLPLFGEQKMVNTDVKRLATLLENDPIIRAMDPLWLGRTTIEQGCLDLAASLMSSGILVFDDPPKFGHGYTCDKCSWGRDGGQTKTYAEYKDHMETWHS